VYKEGWMQNYDPGRTTTYTPCHCYIVFTARCYAELGYATV